MCTAQRELGNVGEFEESGSGREKLSMYHSCSGSGDGEIANIPNTSWTLLCTNLSKDIKY